MQYSICYSPPGVDKGSRKTGSAHCCLGPYWHGRLGRDAFTAWQASAGW